MWIDVKGSDILEYLDESDIEDIVSEYIKRCKVDRDYESISKMIFPKSLEDAMALEDFLEGRL